MATYVGWQFFLSIKLLKQFLLLSDELIDFPF